MTKPLETIWPIEPHTAKKHEILRRYFQAWLPILAQYNPRLLYIDAFAGPGEYSGGEDGSPVVILKAARDHVIPFKSELVCLFIESEDDRHKHLEEVLEGIKPTLPANVKFRPLLGRFNDQLTEIFVNVEEQKKLRAPTLAFVDPFGFSQTPFSAIERLMKYPKTEVLVNFMYEEINRFLSFPQLCDSFRRTVRHIRVARGRENLRPVRPTDSDSRFVSESTQDRCEVRPRISDGKQEQQC